MANIKWRKKDRVKLSRYVQKFNAKITRLEKANPEIADAGLYPDRLNVNDIIGIISTRKDYNRVIKRIDRFFKKDAASIKTLDSGVKITKYEYNEAKIAERVVNIRRKKTREKAGISEARAKEVGLGTINVDERLKEIANRLKPNRNNYTNLVNENQGWKNFLKNVLIQQQDEWFEKKNEQYLKNYYAALDDQLSPSQAAEIKKMIKELGIDGYTLFLINLTNDLTDIDYIYGYEKAVEKFEAIMENIPITLEDIKDE